jgi:hypothetical protein
VPKIKRSVWQGAGPVALKIGYPSQIKLTSQQFVVFGFVTPLKVELTAWVECSAAKIRGQPVRAHPPYDWGFLFKGVPANEFVRVIVEAEDEIGNIARKRIGVVYRPPGFGVITIGFPVTNAGVSNSFDAGGWQDDNTRQVKAWVTQLDPVQGLITVATGTAGSFDPGVIDWDFDFAVPAQYSGPATLNVDYTTGASALAQCGIFLGTITPGNGGSS